MIIVDMDMPSGCVDCKFCVGCKSPKDFPIIECMFIGKIGSMFNFEHGRPVDCPIKGMMGVDLAECEDKKPKK